MFETWPDDSAPNYSIQTTHLKKGTVDHAAKAWSTYGGRVGVWRLMRTFERLGVPATFFVNARCTEVYPDAVKQIAKSGFDIAAHSYTQDDLPSYFSPEEQNGLIRRSIDMLEGCAGKKVTGWGSPVVAFTPETAGLLKKNGLHWTCDVTYADLPIKINTPHGPIAGVPTTDFSDNRVLRASSRDLFDVHRGTFDYLRQNETIGLQTLVIHCQFGGRAADHRGADRASQIHAEVPRRLVHHPRGAGRLGAEAGRRRAHLSRAAISAEEHAMPYATTKDNVKLYYEEAGSGTPILFGHEFAGDYRNWELQMRFFSRRHRCITYSARGYKPSDIPSDANAYSYMHWVSDAVAILDHLKIAKAHFVGLSMGGYTALMLGVHQPGRLLSLTAAGAGSGSDHAGGEDFRKTFMATARRFREARLRVCGGALRHGHRAHSVSGQGPARVRRVQRAVRLARSARRRAHLARLPGRAAVALRRREGDPHHQGADLAGGRRRG